MTGFFDDLGRPVTREQLQASLNMPATARVDVEFTDDKGSRVTMVGIDMPPDVAQLITAARLMRPGEV